MRFMHAHLRTYVIEEMQLQKLVMKGMEAAEVRNCGQDHHQLRTGRQGNDYFVAPRALLAMKLFGLDKATIDKVCYQNPKDFFKLHME